jgi:peptide-methionine (S)-S-oxide reductase
MRLAKTFALSAALLVAAAPAGAAQPQLATAVLAGGCFWGMEAVFEHVNGVRDVVSGYAGGSARDANYEAVSSERTGHAEAIRITYDPTQIIYGQLLDIYARVAHDPTQLNRQGPDTGPSYRSAIFPQNAGQQRAAQVFLAGLNKARVYPRPIVTKVESGAFFLAEASHQDFARRNPNHPYIVAHDRPKVAKLRKTYPQYWRG